MVRREVLGMCSNDDDTEIKVRARPRVGMGELRIYGRTKASRPRA